jgi:hypothetical protein
MAIFGQKLQFLAKNGHFWSKIAIFWPKYGHFWQKIIKLIQLLARFGQTCPENPNFGHFWS